MTDDELLRKLDGWFSTALDHPVWHRWRTVDAPRCHAYREGDQWTPAELAELEKRHQPPTVNNQVSVTCDRMVGQFIQTRTRTAYRSRNQVDDLGAEAQDDIFRFIRQNNGGDFEERDCFEEGAVSGFGAFYAWVEFDSQWRPRIRYKALDALAECIPDPHSRAYDWNEDAQFIFVAKWMPFDEGCALFPQHADKLHGMAYTMTGSGMATAEAFEKRNYVDWGTDGKPRQIRIVEGWYRDYERVVTLAVTMPDGRRAFIPREDAPRLEELRAAGVVWEELVQTRRPVRMGTFCCDVLLERKDKPHGGIEMFPIVPFYVARKKDGQPYSRILLSLSMQDAINFRESRSLHLFNTRSALLGENAVADKDEFATELAKADGLPTARNFDQVQLLEHVDMASGQLSMHQMGKQDYRHITGVNPDSLGEKSEVRSGVGIARKQAMTNLILSGMHDNFRRTRGLLARLIRLLVKQYYNEEMTFTITDDFEKAKVVTVSNAKLDAIRGGDYDEIVTDVPDFATAQQEQLAIVGPLIPQIAQLGPGWGRILLELSDFRNKPELRKLIEEMGAPPPPEPKVNVTLDWSELTAEEKVAWAGKFGLPALAEAQRLNPQPTDNEAKAELEEKKLATQTKLEAVKQLGEHAREGERQQGAKDLEQERSRRAESVATIGAESRKKSGAGGGA